MHRAVETQFRRRANGITKATSPTPRVSRAHAGQRRQSAQMDASLTALRSALPVAVRPPSPSLLHRAIVPSAPWKESLNFLIGRKWPSPKALGDWWPCPLNRITQCASYNYKPDCRPNGRAGLYAAPPLPERDASLPPANRGRAEMQSTHYNCERTGTDALPDRSLQAFTGELTKTHRRSSKLGNPAFPEERLTTG